MTPVWEPSADKHGLSREDQIYAILNEVFHHELEPDEGRGRVILIIGPQHAQTDREVEILVREFPNSNRPTKVFHAMFLGSLYRRFREEHPDGWK